MSRSRRVAGPLWPFLGTAALLATAGCARPDGLVRGLPVPTQAPAQTPGVLSLQAGQRQELLTAARRTDWEYTRRTGAAAARRVRVADGDTQPVTPERVLIYPQRDAYRHRAGDYEKHFIVVARLENKNSVDIPRLGLPAQGFSYWVIFRVGGRWFSYFIADDDRRVDLDHVTEIDYYYGTTDRWQQSVAQWVWDLDPHISDAGSPLLRGKGDRSLLAKEVPWITCTPFGCCKAH